MVTAQDVHEYIAQAGPVLPKHIAEAFGISTLFASAFLSELSSSGKVSTSHLKIGGSPLYYTQTHRDRLVDYRGNLHEKEQKTFELLRSERVLDDSTLQLLDRVALRKMEDFAVPLAVEVGGVRRIFWKYYLASDEQAATLIGELLESERSEARTEGTSAAEPERAAEPNVPSHEPPEQPPELPGPQHPELAMGTSRTEEPSAVAEPIPAERARPQKRESQAKIPTTNVTLTQAPDASEALAPDPFGRRILEYFGERTIRIIEAEVVRKNTCQGVCSVPSSVGELDYYFYAKEKKTITDKDVKEAFAEAAIDGYPLLFIVKGDVKKSATELIGSKIKGSIIIEL